MKIVKTLHFAKRLLINIIMLQNHNVPFLGQIIASDNSYAVYWEHRFENYVVTLNIAIPYVLIYEY